MPPSRSLTAIDWPELVSRLAAEARSARGPAACEALADGDAALADDIDVARAALADVGEAAALLEARFELPGLAFTDVEPELAAAEKEIVLGAEELRPIAALCETAADVRRFFA